MRLLGWVTTDERLIHAHQRTGICICQTQQAVGWVPDSPIWGMAGGSGRPWDDLPIHPSPQHPSWSQGCREQVVPPCQGQIHTRLFNLYHPSSKQVCLHSLPMPCEGANLQPLSLPHELHPHPEHPPSIQVPALGQLRTPARRALLINRGARSKCQLQPRECHAQDWQQFRHHSRTDSQLPPHRRGTSNKWKELFQLLNSSSPWEPVSTKSCSTAVIQIIFNYLVTN